jgi:hypothetical protein
MQHIIGWMHRNAITGIATLLWLAVASPARAGLMDSFRDPEDGAFDMSTYLLERKGALPVPIVITEPAVGYGGGLALVFFRQSIKELAEQNAGTRRYRPPDAFAGAGFATENGTWGAGAGGLQVIGDDRWRVSGGGGYVHANLAYYVDDRALDYSLDGAGAMVKLQYRLVRTNAWIAMHARYFKVDSEFDSETGAPERPTTRTIGGLGPMIEYDSRDNMFTPTSGWAGGVKAMYYDPAFGSDESFRVYDGHVYAYTPLPGPFTLGTRVGGAIANGETPFYMLPYVEQRGIAAQRYQGRNTAVVEGELQWHTSSRWTLLGFYGAGRAWGVREYADVDTHGAGGGGFRYMLARLLKMSGGIDFAWGPEFALYLQVGTAWR